MAFSNNQQLLLWMGFFTDAQNDRGNSLLWMGFFFTRRRRVKDPSAFKKYTTIIAVRGILR
jgi:hypothetical protein